VMIRYCANFFHWTNWSYPDRYVACLNDESERFTAYVYELTALAKDLSVRSS
jgi:hypothetical protein